MNPIEAYPLQWPYGHSRARFKIRSAFHQKTTTDEGRTVFKCRTFGQVRDRLISEIKKLGGSDMVISTNIPLKKDGMPFASYAALKDCGVAVYFRKNKRPYVLACDKWDRIEDNLYALCLTIEAMRGLERWGVSDMLERTFQGFTALPPPSPDQIKKDWWEMLECSRTSDIASIESAYRKLALKNHPDSGGSHERMASLNLAVEEARFEKEGK